MAGGAENAREGGSRVGVLLTSHPRQQLWMRQGIWSLYGFPGPVVLGYDDVDADMLPLDQIMPPVTEIFMTGNRWPPGSGHVRGELLQMKRGGEILAELGCTHVFKACADSTAYLWRTGFRELLRLMREREVKVVCAGTALVFAETEAYRRIMSDYHENVRCGSAELYWFHKMRDELRIPHVADWPDWNAKLGRFHVHGHWALQQGIGIGDAWAVGELWPREGKPVSHERRMEIVSELRARRKAKTGG